MLTLSRGRLKMGAAAIGGLTHRTGSGAPSNGSSGTGAGISGYGSGAIYLDTASGIPWLNVGTNAAPVWCPLAPVTFNVSSANILAMNATPVNLIAAPGAGYCVIIDNILIEMVRTSTQYASGGVVSFVYTGGSTAGHSGTLPASVVTGAAGTVLTQLGPATGSSGTTVPTNTGIDITNATAAFTTGTGTMKVMIDYRVIAQ